MSELSVILKESGLEIAEDVAIATVKSVLKALPSIVAKTENKYDDMIIPILAVIEPKILELLDGIDGKVDQA